MHKIIPLVLFVSVSLIIGNQAAFAQTDVWAFYGEVGGSSKDATTSDNAPLSSTMGIAGVSSTFQITDGVEEYQNVANAATAPRTGPLLVARCFEGIPNPTSEAELPNVADWIFGAGNAVPFQCVQNQRNSQDLGLGVNKTVVPLAAPLFQPLEVGVGQLVVIDLNAILPTNPTNPHTNFMFRISSNSAGETAWVAVSDKGPEDTPLLFPDDFDLLGPASGFFPGCSRGGGCDNNDADISFIPKRFLYYTQTDDRQDNLLQQIKATKIPDDMVGGHGGITDNTALLVSGSHLTASWMIPLIVSAIGIGVFVVTRK
jgi:hypothetical protein